MILKGMSSSATAKQHEVVLSDGDKRVENRRSGGVEAGRAKYLKDTWP